MVLIAFLAVFIVMLVLWLIQLKSGNAGIVDIAWSYNFGIIAIVYYLYGSGFEPRKMLIAAMVVVWSLRLGMYLFMRVMGHYKEEDSRYKQLREEWKKNLDLKFFLFFQFQAVLNVILSIPFLLMVMNDRPGITVLEWAGLCIWIIAVTGEGIADYQLKLFKKNPANKGKVCDRGLWYYSRHPNYFFEWMIWIAYFVAALSSPYGWISIICPLLMSWFLFKVTGIPMTEEQAVRSKGQAYIDYQNSTSVFVPWFKKTTGRSF